MMSDPTSAGNACSINGPRQSPGAGLDARGLPAGYPFKPDWEITPREVKGLLDQAANVLLIDCRRPDEHQLANIAQAKLLPMDQLEKRTDELEDDDGGKNTPIIVHCHHGGRSMRVTGALRAMGFTNVKSMAGGIDLWSIDIDPTIKRY